MPTPHRALLPLILAIGLPACSFPSPRAQEAMDAAPEPAAASVPRFGLFELSVVHQGNYNNKYADVTVKGVFRSPGGRDVTVKGFFESGQTWKIRFVPDETGTWTYSYTLDNGTATAAGQGSFDCTAAVSDGPVQAHPQNPFRWRFASGKPYYPVGLQDCVTLEPNGQISDFSVDGEARTGPVTMLALDQYLELYGAAGFNLLRFSQDNCSYKLYDDLNHYRPAEIAATETLLKTARDKGYRILFGFFGFAQGYHREWDVPGGDASGTHLSPEEKRFLDYCIARWGPYVDFWELLNERTAPDSWLAEAADYVRSADPGRKPVGTSWERPDLAEIDFSGPHWFEAESEFASDLRVAQRALEWKKAGKPVIVGEQGNSGMNWDPLSALRMRMRLWTALFQEIAIVFWNTSWSKAGVNQGVNVPGSTANIYLGPQERGYVKVLQQFSANLDADLEMVPVTLSGTGVRGYAVASPRTAAVYLHHFDNHTSTVQGLQVTLEASMPGPAIAKWIDPASGAVLSEQQLQPGRISLKAPDFTIDAALIVISL